MKRRVKCLAVALALLMGLALPAPALAAEPTEPAVTVELEDGSYTVRCVAGAENACALFSLRVESSGADAVMLYLAQAKADGSGTVTFENVRPTVRRGMKFLVSGGSLTTPAEARVEMPGTVVMGQVSLHGRADSSGVTVTLTDSDGAPTVCTTKYDGSYMTDALMPGNYEVAVEAEGYRAKTESVLLTDVDLLVRGSVTLYILGDVNKDTEVDEEDVSALLLDFGKTKGFILDGSDVNADGYVNGADLALLREGIAEISGAKPEQAPALSVELGGVGGKAGAYALTVTPAPTDSTKAPVRRVEAMVSWDASLLTLADSRKDYAAVTPADGDNQKKWPGAADFSAAGGAAFYTGEGRNACYLAISETAREPVPPSGTLYFRFKEGKTAADLRKGSIRVETNGSPDGFLSRILPESDRYGALLGHGGTENETFPDGELEVRLAYPGSTIPVLAALELRTETDLLVIPPADSTAPGVLSLTAAAVDTEGDDMPLPADYALSQSSAPGGVALVGNELRAEKTAAKGDAVVVLRGGGLTTEKTVKVVYAYPEPTSIQLNRSGSPLGETDRLTIPNSGSSAYSYTAVLLDQYGVKMDPPQAAAFAWSFTGGNSAVTALNGTVTVGAGASTDGHYTLTAALDQLTKSVSITLAFVAQPPKTDKVTVGSDGDTTTVKVETIKKKDGSYTATLDNKAAEKILKTAAGKTGPVVIAATAGEKSAKATVTLPASMPAGLAKGGHALTVELPAARIEVSSGELGKLDGGLSVSARQVSATRAAVDLNGGDKEISFTASVPAGNSAAGLTALLVAEDGSLSPVRKSAVVDGLLLVPLTGSATFEWKDNSKPFADMAGSWAADSVAFVSARTLFSGTGADAFAPEANMSRGMLATVLYRLEGEPRAAGEAPAFTDVERGAWYADGAAWCAAAGVTSGKDGGRFDPDGAITREELALMLFALAAPEKTDPVAEQHSFADRGAVSPWAVEAMEWAAATGLLAGRSGNRLAPGATATRAEVAAVLERFVKLEYGKGGAK